ncbi:MAG: VRR-NUC domain-containing protein [Aestuariivirga sp.]
MISSDKIRERDIEKAFTAKVKAAGGEIRKVKWIGRKGAPDRVVMLNGMVWWVEFKAPGKRPTAQQASEHRRMRKMGMLVLVIDHFVVDWWRPELNPK